MLPETRVDWEIESCSIMLLYSCLGTHPKLVNRIVVSVRMGSKPARAE